MEAIIGQQLLSKTGLKPLSSILSTDIILWYFSAHWCPPCRAFTPQLMQFYNQVNESSKRLEIIFVSLDRSESDFMSYFNNMPWIAMQYSGPRDAVSQQFGINSIPALLLISNEGEVKGRNCRTEVENIGPGVIEQWKSQLN